MGLPKWVSKESRKGLVSVGVSQILLRGNPQLLCSVVQREFSSERDASCERETEVVISLETRIPLTITVLRGKAA